MVIDSLCLPMTQATWMESQTEEVLFKYEDPQSRVQHEASKIKVNAQDALEEMANKDKK